MDMSRTNIQGQGRGRWQIFEDEDEDKVLASRPTCPRGLNITVTMWAEVHSYPDDTQLYLQAERRTYDSRQQDAATSGIRWRDRQVDWRQTLEIE